MSEFDIIGFLKKAVSIDASDVHLHVGEHPVLRKDGKIVKIDMPVLTDADLEHCIDVLTPQHLKRESNLIKDLDFAYEIKNLSRFRVNISRQLAQLAITIRLIPYLVKSFEELYLPEMIKTFTRYNNGLILVTGPTGSGKSTTVASIIDYINANYPKHIISLEDPIEFVYTNKKSIVSQRQLLVDTLSFEDGLKYALRQDPDVISIGEIRDQETITSALKAAETGHLVFATIHTNNAVATVNRIVNMYEPNDRPFVRCQLAGIMRGTISQTLVPHSSGVGRRAACEVLEITGTVQDYIIKDELEQIYDLVKKGNFSNMITLNMALYDLLKKGDITAEEALKASYNENELQQMIRGVYHGPGYDK